MNIRKLGFRSSAACFLIFCAYIVCFVLNYRNNPSFSWKTAGDFIRYENAHDEIFKYLAMALMVVFGICFVLQLECFRETVKAEKRFAVGVAVHFAVGFSLLTGVAYFVQIGAARLSVAAGQTEGIGQLVQANPNSFVSAVNLLGWTLFLGVSCLFVSAAAGGGPAGRVIRYSTLANGLMMLTACAAYLLGIVILQALLMFLGLGAAMMTEAAAMCFYFRPEAGNNP